MSKDTLVKAILDTWADREKLEAALKNAPPADGTERVLELIEEIQG
jgi:UDP-N-acetylglucosamine--N-acetylmuramyl-(pentapeptide) pyrophosphoryl-undecaprenol N-acetylglucosamine transferase